MSTIEIVEDYALQLTEMKAKCTQTYMHPPTKKHLILHNDFHNFEN